MKNLLLHKYISREFTINFLLSFFFFFFIFFINQLLVMLRLEEVKNLSVKVILRLILLSTPQFLTFTFPFSTLTASAMAVGDFAEKNEILALRSLGFSLKQIYLPFLLMSFITTGGTYWIANTVNPWAASQYKKVYGKVIRDMPTIALKPNSVTTVGHTTVSVGDSDGKNLDDVRIFDVSNAKSSKLLSARSGRLEQKNKNEYIYQLELDHPDIMFTSSDDRQYSAGTADSLTYSIDMSSMLPDFGEPSSSQVKNAKLRREIKREKSDEPGIKKKNREALRDALNRICDKTEEINTAGTSQNAKRYAEEQYSAYKKINEEIKKPLLTYRRLYYETEFFKRMALSLACVVLSLLAFPLSFFKVRHGRLIGFAMSMIISVIYWSLLFYSQILSLSTARSSIKPMVRMMIPNILFLFIAFVMLRRFNKT